MEYNPAMTQRMILINRLYIIALDSLSEANRGNVFISKSEAMKGLNEVRATIKRVLLLLRRHDIDAFYKVLFWLIDVNRPDLASLVYKTHEEHGDGA